jgi:dienelactone hydrolase
MTMVEELVSRGFAVVGIDHPYGSAVAAFPDGRVVHARTDVFLDTSTDESLQHSYSVAEEQLGIRVADLRFVLDRLEAMNAGGGLGPLNGRLRFDLAGAIGYSFGGAVAAEACALDARFRGAIDLDGDLFGTAARDGVERPLMIVSDSFDPPAADDLASPVPARRRDAKILDTQARLVQNTFTRYGGYRLQIPGMLHAELSDDFLLSPAGWLKRRASKAAPRILRIVDDYALAFFGSLLNGRGTPQLESLSRRYRKVRLTVFPRQQPP